MDQLFACRAVVEAALLAADVTSLRTEGFHTPGDRGGASYRRVPAQPAHGGCLRSADGAWWQIHGTDLSVLQFGALGDGTTDDSDALQAALDCPQVRALRLPAGRYRAIGLTLRHECAVVGEAAELFWDVPDDPRDLLYISAPGANLRGLTLSGLRYTDLDSPVSPVTLLRIDPPTPQDASEVRLQDLTFIGGRMGCVIGLVTNVFIDRLRFEHCRDYALILSQGPRRIIINGLIATGIGAYGALKTAFTGTVRATERLVVNDFVITDCARAASDPTLWQEGLDLICGFAREFVISNGVISNCGNGGIELKTGGLLIDADDQYQDMVISNVVISQHGNHHAIVLNWTGGKVNSGKRGRRIVLTGNIIRHENADDTGGCGIMVDAWSELHISNNYIEGAHTGIVLTPHGASDETVRDVRIADNHMRNVQKGIVAYKGRVESLDVSGNMINCAQVGVALNGARCRDVVIAHNRIRQRGKMVNMMACIEVRNAREVEIWNNHLESEHGNAVTVLDPSQGVSGGAILRNVVRTAAEPFRIEGGQWEVFENHVRTAPHTRTLKLSAEAHVTAASNVRGLRDAAPTDRGSPGDLMLTAGLPTHPPGWWFDPSAQQNQGGWSMLAVVAPPPHSNGVSVGSDEEWTNVSRAKNLKIGPVVDSTQILFLLEGDFTKQDANCWGSPLPPNLACFTDNEDAPSQSPLLLLENGKTLGDGHNLHAEVSAEGRGLYSFWNGHLYFSTSDNSDPNINGRRYEIGTRTDFLDEKRYVLAIGQNT